MVITPFDEVKKKISKKIPIELLGYLPNKWEKIGDVLIIKIPSKLFTYKEIVAENYSKVLNCKTVLGDFGGISGVYREPNVEILWGSKDTETIHLENGIRYKLDPRKIMFSSGNMDERIRMASISNYDETVVDLFAGIGYFTLPIAVYCKPKKIFSCELNPIAFRYLSDNIVLNDVTSVVKPLLGDNKVNAPKNVADRVILGYFKNNHKFLQTAIDGLKNNCGILHYHDLSPDDSIPNKSLNLLNGSIKKYNRRLEVLNVKHVKSYAPGISHIVLDVEIGI